jgi:hypothetical protein
VEGQFRIPRRHKLADPRLRNGQSRLAAWCAVHDVPSHGFDWQSEHGAAGLARDALYLLRPDTYVALAEPTGQAGTIKRYCAEHGIQVGEPTGPRTSEGVETDAANPVASWGLLGITQFHRSLQLY